MSKLHESIPLENVIAHQVWLNTFVENQIEHPHPHMISMGQFAIAFVHSISRIVCADRMQY